MKKNKGSQTLKKNIFISLIALSLLASSSCFAEYPEENLIYMGYSDELIDVVDEEIGLTDFGSEKEDEEYISEVDSTVEQLKELGVSRSITENTKIRTNILRQKNEEFWNGVFARRENQDISGVVVSEETKALIKSNIEKALTDDGYKIVQLDIIPLAEYSTKNAVRAVVRVVKPMKTGSYNEVQTRLSSIKEICTKAATIDGHCMLSEMTTFIAENPKNKYYYEKTILR